MLVDVTSFDKHPIRDMEKWAADSEEEAIKFAEIVKHVVWWRHHIEGYWGYAKSNWHSDNFSEFGYYMGVIALMSCYGKLNKDEDYDFITYDTWFMNMQQVPTHFAVQQRPQLTPAGYFMESRHQNYATPMILVI